MEGRTILTWGLTGVGILLFLGYSAYAINDFIRGPRIIILSPQHGVSTTTPLVAITGYGVRTTNVTVNGTKIAVDLNGNFKTNTILAPGYNNITVAARDNYERHVEKSIEINLMVPLPIATTTATTTEEVIEGVIEQQKDTILIE